MRDFASHHLGDLMTFAGEVRADRSGGKRRRFAGDAAGTASAKSRWRRRERSYHDRPIPRRSGRWRGANDRK